MVEKNANLMTLQNVCIFRVSPFFKATTLLHNSQMEINENTIILLWLGHVECLECLGECVPKKASIRVQENRIQYTAHFSLVY